MKRFLSAALFMLAASTLSCNVAMAQANQEIQGDKSYTTHGKPKIVKHWRSNGYYSVGNKIYNAKNKKMCSVGGEIIDFVVSPNINGESYAVLYKTHSGTNKLYVGSLWKTKKRIANLNKVKNPQSICYSNSGRTLNIAGGDNHLYIYRAYGTFPLENRLSIGFKATNMCVSHDSQMIAFASDKEVMVHNISEAKSYSTIKLDAKIRRMEFVPDSSHIIILTEDRVLSSYDVQTSSLINKIGSLGDAIDFAVDPNGDYAAVVTSSHRIAVVNLSNPDVERSYPEVKEGIVSVDFVASGEQINYLNYSTGKSLEYTLGWQPKVSNANLLADAATAEVIEAPKFSEYSRDYIETRLDEWVKRGQFESIAEHELRVNDATIKAKADELGAEARKAYLDEYTPKHALLSGAMQLGSYDTEHGSFLITSDYGNIIVAVPRENDEAKNFASAWNGVSLENPEYDIYNDGIVISKLTLVTPRGYTYEYDGTKALTHTESNVEVNYNIDYSKYSASNSDYKESEISRIHTSRGEAGDNNKPRLKPSDVDINIPETGIINENTHVVIIANSDYDEGIPDIPVVANDGAIFKEYCIKTLGIPEKHIIYEADATSGKLQYLAKHKIIDIPECFPNSNLIFYYSGHGYPSKSGDAYIIPKDGNPEFIEGCLSLDKLYSQLGNAGFNNILVLMDCCFSGAGKGLEMENDDNLLADNKGLKYDHRPAEPCGNMVILSASSQRETATAYKDKSHSLFTYFLLKKLQESKGDVTLGDLFEYVKTHVRQESYYMKKDQTPQAIAAPIFRSKWRDANISDMNTLVIDNSESSDISSVGDIEF